MSGIHHKSAEELQLLRRKLTQTQLPYRSGPKDSVPDESEEQAERLEEQLEQFDELLSEERILRKGNISVGKWNNDKKIAEVDISKGVHWQVFGKTVGGKIILQPEEALYMTDHGMLEMYYRDLPMSLQQVYEMILCESFPLHHYVVYSYLRNFGFIVLRHEKRMKEKLEDRKEEKVEQKMEEEVEREVEEKRMELQMEERKEEKLDERIEENVEEREKEQVKEEKGEKVAKRMGGEIEQRMEEKVEGTIEDNLEGIVEGEGNKRVQEMLKVEMEEKAEERMEEKVEGTIEDNLEGIVEGEGNKRVQEMLKVEMEEKAEERMEEKVEDRKEEKVEKRIDKKVGEEMVGDKEAMQVDNKEKNESKKEEEHLEKEDLERSYVDAHSSRFKSNKDGPVSHYWEDDQCQPLVHPSDATSLENILNKLHIIKSQYTSVPTEETPSATGRFQITFDVFQPQKKFKKSDPGLPNHSVCICKFSDPPPTVGEMNSLTRQSYPVPLKYAVVDGKDVSFYSFSEVQLPTYLES